MKKCKNIECNNLIEDRLTYCSLTCRNIYVNKYIRNYSKYIETTKEKRNKKINEYLKIPKHCKTCGGILNYEKRKYYFCSRSCAAFFTTPGRKVSVETRQKISKSLSGRKSKYDAWNKGKSFIEKRACKNCGNLHNNKVFCCRQCRSECERKNNGDYENYRLDCVFNFSLSEYSKEFDFELLRKYGIYQASNRGNNLNGIVRDHMYSVYDGFCNNIKSEIIRHPANCRLIRQSENSRKWKKSSITLEELKQRINEWNKKYM